MEDVTARRVVVVTGASSGIGLAAALAFAQRGDQVVLVGRDPGRLAAAQAVVRDASGADPVVHRADFAVLDQVRALAGKLRAEFDRIDVLANNAGAMSRRRVTTVDGFELTVQGNHLAPFLLTNLLLDRLAGGRVVLTSSAVQVTGVVDPTRLAAPPAARYSGMQAYAASKRANVLFAAEAARRWPRVLTTAYSPGIVRTDFGRAGGMYGVFFRAAPFLRTPAQGADTMVWLATAPAGQLTNGGFYVRRRLRATVTRPADQRLAAELWDASEKAVGLS